jgi:hypothetical protein
MRGFPCGCHCGPRWMNRSAVRKRCQPGILGCDGSVVRSPGNPVCLLGKAQAARIGVNWLAANRLRCRLALHSGQPASSRTGTQQRRRRCRAPFRILRVYTGTQGIAGR